ncbi:pre-peptidase C-terminal domain-containing protein [Pseudoalteromonas fenneropenaei]|uniref:Pre-peptidase C-terminal domain-containing protein n=1 Tax=Pseudoalteromonas fenneropenaei TaxID=1737459 RepID=A0ABV7CGJ7_9GAMM
MKLYQTLGGLACLTGATLAHAGSQYHRLIWDASPQSQATIGFTPNGGSDHHVMYGTSSNESQWQRKNVSASRTFAASLSSQFVKLTGLPSNSAVYYRVCDSTGCGARLWFKTAPNDNSAFTAIAGGDTRTGWTTRRQGNALVAKIRPLFIMHGGDYTNANNASEMTEYLKDWQLTFSDDLIGGQSYQRIYPFIATHGNHEDGNFNTLCEVFGVDYNQDGQCNAHDTYGAVAVSPLLKVYTLNSQFQNSGWSSYATAMNNWLSSDLGASQSHTWRIGQYHKPMFPHYTGKSDNTTLHSWWAQVFNNQKMHLLVESDTHINKLTQPLIPTSNNFTATTNGGTVYVGEGSWGAPARSANDPKSWTLDLASIQQFKVLSVLPDKLLVRTAQFDASAEALSQEARDADPIALPGNVNWWQVANLGEVVTLVKTANGLVKIDQGTVPPDGTPHGGETFNNLSASKGNWYRTSFSLPAGVTSLSVSISGGSGDADLYVKRGSEPSTSSYDCRPYKDGNSETCPITNPAAGTWHLGVRAYATFSGVTLSYQY